LKCYFWAKVRGCCPVRIEVHLKNYGLMNFINLIPWLMKRGYEAWICYLDKNSSTDYLVVNGKKYEVEYGKQLLENAVFFMRLEKRMCTTISWEWRSKTLQVVKFVERINGVRVCAEGVPLPSFFEVFSEP